MDSAYADHPARGEGALMFSQQVADSVCNLLAQGKSLRAACADVSASPVTILRWVKAHEGFSEQYAHARELGYMLLADEIIAIADTPVVATKSVSKASGLEITEGDAVDRSRLMVDARKWMLSKMLPKVYGEKQSIEINDVTPKTPEQVNSRIAELLAKAAQKTGD